MSVDSQGGIDMLGGNSTAAPMSGQDSAHKRNSDVAGLGLSSVGLSTEHGTGQVTTLPDVHPNSSKGTMQGYQTH